MTALVLALALSAGPARWSGADTAREGAFDLVLAVDGLQTWKMQGDTQRFGRDLNPLIRGRRSVRPVFVGGAALHAGVSLLLQGRWRTLWQESTIMVEVLCVTNNYGLGVRLKW